MSSKFTSVKEEDQVLVKPAPAVLKADPYGASSNKNYQIDTKSRRLNANTALGDEEEKKQ